MALTAIPEEIPCRFADSSGSAAEVAAKKVEHEPMTVKRTFIELSVPASEFQRGRSFTDSDLLNADDPIRLPEMDLSDGSTDVASDAEELASLPRLAEWESPYWGPAGDLYYNGDACSPLFSPLLQADVPTSDEYFFPPMQDDAAWNLPPGFGALDLPPGLTPADFQPPGLPAPGFGGMMPLDPWLAYASFENGLGLGFDVGNSQASALDDAALDNLVTTINTTLMLRNLPVGFTRNEVIELLEDEGFEGSYDLVYVPMDFSCRACLGYAFVNFVAVSDAARCWTVFDGFVEWGTPSDKVCEVTWSQPNQGLEALIERYRNSPVMHESVPEFWKPAYFVEGVQASFPAPTKKIKAPQMKTRKGKVEKR